MEKLHQMHKKEGSNSQENETIYLERRDDREVKII